MPFKIKNEAGEEVEILTAAENAEMITGAMKSHGDKLAKKLTADITSSVSAAMAESLTAYETKREETAAAAEAERLAAGGAPAKTKGNEATDIENSPAFKGMEKRLNAALKKAEETEQRVKAEKTKQRDIMLRQKIGEELDKEPGSVAVAVSQGLPFPRSREVCACGASQGQGSQGP